MSERRPDQTGEAAGDEPPVLIFAPGGQDAAVATGILNAAGIATTLSETVAELATGIADATCAIVTEEALHDVDRGPLAGTLAGQPPWSRIPVVVLTMRGTPPDEDLVGALGNVTLLERPFHPAALVTTVRFAMDARRRQREAAAYLAERRETAERQSLLIRELHHRVKNTLATVQALLGASARSATSIEGFYGAFSARIGALARTHDLLTEDYWQTASLKEMFCNELSPYDSEGSRIALSGPAVELNADLAVPTGMAIHELTTNAARHGALSVPRGRIDVTWSVAESGERDGAVTRRLCIEWIERDGPPAAEPVHRGFGSTLLQRVLTIQCGADIRFDFQPAGLRFHMEAPLADRRLVPAY